MLTTRLHNGQGLGNQLACYVTTRCLALDKGFEFGIENPENFKGASFMSLDFGRPVTGGITAVEGHEPLRLPVGIERYYREKTNLHPNGTNISGYDDNLRNLRDNTKIDGLMQGEDYFLHRKEEIREWLRTEPLEMPEDVCIIAFRGGEYKYVRDFFLPKSYWENAMAEMLKRFPFLRFEVVTDDVEEARRFFPGLGITHEIGEDWRKIRNAHYLILSNSSFAILPAFLNENAKRIIAPKFFGRFNVSDGYWCLEQNIMSGWDYLDREGSLWRCK